MVGAAPRSAVPSYCLVRTVVIAANRMILTEWIVCYPLTRCQPLYDNRSGYNVLLILAVHRYLRAGYEGVI